jgi:hypothetical protein
MPLSSLQIRSQLSNTKWSGTKGSSIQLISKITSNNTNVQKWLTWKESYRNTTGSRLGYIEGFCSSIRRYIG